MNWIRFGEQVDGYDIPVLNEREIRAAAGILFLGMLIAIVMVIFEGQFTLLKYTISLFLADMLIRVVINPRFSPSLILGRLMVRKQTPIYVGAPQKKFAWLIGIGISGTLFWLLVVNNYFHESMGLACLVCLLFLFFETAFGICIGCKIYALFNRGQVKYCPGEVCATENKQKIQYISRPQLMVPVMMVVMLVFVVTVFGAFFAQAPL